ncbi:MAG: 4Fe-4S binding protein [Chloroflexi bacterium]|nr:4Fe-4S binding protein [Chloroflexota bacterium]
MAVESINSQRCNGCGICVQSCPADVLRMDGERKKVVIRYPDECVVCCWCIAECPTDAIVLTPTRYNRIFTSWG